MKLYLKALMALIVVSSLFLAGCGGTWDIRKDNISTRQQTSSDEIAVIERLEGRFSPKVKTFTHTDLDFYKESGGSRHNDAFAVNRVETLPGNIKLGVVLPNVHRTYYPEVKLNVKPNQKYYLTWVCIPYPFVAVVDDSKSKIVAIDSYCPDCNWIIGSQLTQSSECLPRHLQPPWMEPDERSAWLPWLMESHTQMFRNLCYAAEHNLQSAQMRLGDLFSLGIYGFSRDKTLAFMWYSRASALGNKQAIKSASILRNRLSSLELKKAHALLKDWQLGKCEKDILGTSKQRYKIQIGN